MPQRITGPAPPAPAAGGRSTPGRDPWPLWQPRCPSSASTEGPGRSSQKVPQVAIAHCSPCISGSPILPLHQGHLETGARDARTSIARVRSSTSGLRDRHASASVTAPGDSYQPLNAFLHCSPRPSSPPLHLCLPHPLPQVLTNSRTTPACRALSFTCRSSWAPCPQHHPPPTEEKLHWTPLVYQCSGAEGLLSEFLTCCPKQGRGLGSPWYTTTAHAVPRHMARLYSTVPAIHGEKGTCEGLGSYLAVVPRAQRCQLLQRGALLLGPERPRAESKHAQHQFGSSAATPGEPRHHHQQPGPTDNTTPDSKCNPIGNLEIRGTTQRAGNEQGKWQGT